MSKYKNKILTTKEFIKIFGSEYLINKYKKNKKLNNRSKDGLLIKANKICNIKNIDRDKYIFTEIYDNVYLENISEHPLYKTFHGMKQRCYNPNAQWYENYGGRGITICDEWLEENGLMNFIKWAEENGYIPYQDLTIDRKDNDKGYSPDNCRWVTWDIQMLNRRSSKKNIDTYEESRIELFYI